MGKQGNNGNNRRGNGNGNGSGSGDSKVENLYRFEIIHPYAVIDKTTGKVTGEDLSSSIVGVKSIAYMSGTISTGGFIQFEVLEGPNINTTALLQAFKVSPELDAIYMASRDEIVRAQGAGRKFSVTFEEKDHGRGNVVLGETIMSEYGGTDVARLGHLYATSNGSVGNFSFRRICLALLLNEAAKRKPGPCPLDLSQVSVTPYVGGSSSAACKNDDGTTILGNIGDLISL